jgi:hypothetical protein
MDFGFDEPGHMEVDCVNLREAREKIKWNLCVLYICCCSGPEQRRTFEQMIKLAVFNKVPFKKFAEETGILRIPGGLKSCRTYEKMFADYWQEWNDQVAAVKSAVVPPPSTLASACKDFLPGQNPNQPATGRREGSTYRGSGEVAGIKRSSDGVPKPKTARKTQRLDINTCDERELMIVVGAGIAERIIQKRTELGGFKNMADLKQQVAGVGGSKLEHFALRGFTVLPPPTKRDKVAEEATPATSRTETEDAPRCPITHEPFKDPVVASCCGHSFERDAIMKWIHIDVGKNRGGANCPLCDCPLNKRMLVPNRTLMQNPQ